MQQKQFPEVLRMSIQQTNSQIKSLNKYSQKSVFLSKKFKLFASLDPSKTYKIKRSSQQKNLIKKQQGSTLGVSHNQIQKSEKSKESESVLQKHVIFQQLAFPSNKNNKRKSMKRSLHQISKVKMHNKVQNIHQQIVKQNQKQDRIDNKNQVTFQKQRDQNLFNIKRKQLLPFYDKNGDIIVYKKKISMNIMKIKGIQKSLQRKNYNSIYDSSQKLKPKQNSFQKQKSFHRNQLSHKIALAKQDHIKIKDLKRRAHFPRLSHISKQNEKSINRSQQRATFSYDCTPWQTEHQNQFNWA